jgi:serine/threonine protein kinase
VPACSGETHGAGFHGTPLAIPISPSGDPGSKGYDFLAPAQAPDELGRIGPYRILKVLGLGGMGVVFQAEDPRLKRAVAIKAMLPSVAAQEVHRRRFLREARAAAAIEHRHVITVYDVGEHSTIPFLVMQLLQGETLEARAAREGILPLPEVLRIGREMAEGLAAAHDRGLVHRDIKPSNLWLQAPHGRIKVLDFGLARPVAANGRLTQAGQVLGTPAYMAPEQARGQPIDLRTDLFSLGCVLYRLCTGRVPFRGPDPLAILEALVGQEPCRVEELNPAVPTELAALIHWLLAKGPADRPPSAHTVTDIMAGIAADHGARPGAALSPAGPVRPAPEATEVLGLGDLELRLEGHDTRADQVPDSPTPTGEQPEESEELATYPSDWTDELTGWALGRYQVGPLVGRGPHGAVFRARDQKTEREVALKVLAPDFPRGDAEVRRFVQVLKVLLTVRHPNVVSVYGAGKTRPHCWLAREYVEGGNLAGLIGCREAARKKTGWRLALRVAVHVARALELASRLGLTHGRLTPENILWHREEKAARVSDLVLGQALHGSLLEQATRQERCQAGRAYLAPEQLDGSRGDHLSDLYSLGAVLYALLTGRPPFPGESAEEVLEQVCTSTPVKPTRYQRSIPPELEWVVLTLLARDRRYRFQSPAELLLHLDQVALEQGLAV